MTGLNEIKNQCINEQNNMKQLLNFLTNYQYGQNKNNNNKDIKIVISDINVLFDIKEKKLQAITQEIEDLKSHSQNREVSLYNDKRLLTKNLEEVNQKSFELTEFVEVLKCRESEARRLLQLANEELKKLRKK